MIIKGLKKELMLLTRGGRLIGILLLVLGLCLAYPALYKFSAVMMEQLTEMGQQIGGEMGDFTNSFNEGMGSLTEQLGGSFAEVGFFGAVLSYMGEGFLILSLILMATAGGEQKKRSVIIPNCAGLTPEGYVLPKFILYPIFYTVLTFIGILLAGVITQLLFDTAIATDQLFFSALCASVFNFYMTALYFTLGLCTGKAGMAVVVVFLGTSLLQMLLQGADMLHYNPYALYVMASSPVAEVDKTDFAVSLAITIGLSICFCLITLVVRKVKKIDNSQGEANL